MSPSGVPFPSRGIDADNGRGFINDHLYRYCQAHEIQFTRERPWPYKKDDNAHVEQKNWAHVRKLGRSHRYDTPAAVAALNNLYRHELRLFQNPFLPTVERLRKDGGEVAAWRYDAPRTSLDRLQACSEADPAAVAGLVALRDQLDPFALAATIDRKPERLVARATPARAPVRSGVSFAFRPSRRHAQPPRPTHLRDFTFGNRLPRPMAPRASVTSWMARRSPRKVTLQKWLDRAVAWYRPSTGIP